MIGGFSSTLSVSVFHSSLVARGGGVLPYITYIGMCCCEGYQWFLTSLVWSRA